MAEKLNVSTKDAEKSIKLKIASFCDLIGKDGAEAAINDLKTPDPIVHEQADVLLKGLLEEYNYLYNVSTSSPQMVIPLRRSRNELIRFFIDLPERFFRSNLVRSISEAMWKFSKLGPVSDDINLMDIRGLALARRFLSAQTLTHRLVGIQEISNYITDFHYYVQQSKGRNKRSAQQLGDRLAQWILEQHILQLIFCTSIHNEVLQRSCLLVQFLCNMGYMDTSHITLMWDAAKDTFCCRAVYEVFQSIVGDLNGECLVYLFDLVYASMMQSKPDEWNDVLIKLAHDVQRNVWTSTSVKELSQGSEERVSIESSSPENEEDDDSDDEEENSEANANAKKIIFQRESTRHKFVHDLLKDDSLDDSDEYDESTTSGSSVESLDADDEQSSAGDMSEIRWIEGERRASTVNRVTPESPATASPINDQMEAELILMRNIEANRICANEANKKAKTFLRNSEEVVPPIQASDEDKSKMLMAAKMLLLGDPEAFILDGKKRRGPPNIVVPDKSQNWCNLQLENVSDAEQSDTGNSPASDADKRLRDFMDLDEEVQKRVDSKAEELSSSETSLITNDDEEEGSSDPDFDPDFEPMQEKIDKIKLNLHQKVANEVNPARAIYNLKKRVVKYDLSKAAHQKMTIQWDLLKRDDIRSQYTSMVNRLQHQLTAMLSNFATRPVLLSFLYDCLSNLKTGTAVVVSINILQCVIQKLKAIKPSTIAQVTKCEKDYNPVGLIIHSLTTLEKTEIVILRTASRCSTMSDSDAVQGDEFSKEVSSRLRFLTIWLNFFSKRNWDDSGGSSSDDTVTENDAERQLTEDEINLLWNVLLNKLDAQQEFFDWLRQMHNSVRFCLLGQACVEALFYTLIPSIEPVKTLPGAYLVYKNCFDYLSRQAESTVEMDALAMQAYDHIWKLAMNGTADVFQQTGRFFHDFCFVDMNINRSGVSGERFKRLMSSVMERFAEVDGLLDKTLVEAVMSVYRCCSLIRQQLDWYKSSYSYFIRLRHLCGHNVLPHLANNFAKVGFNVTASIDTNLILKTSCHLPVSAFLGELRGDIAYQMAVQALEDEKSDFADVLCWLEKNGPIRTFFDINNAYTEFEYIQDNKTLKELGLRDEGYPINVESSTNALVKKGGYKCSRPRQKPQQSLTNFAPEYDGMPMVILSKHENISLLIHLFCKALDKQKQLAANESLYDNLSHADASSNLRRIMRSLWETLVKLPSHMALVNELRNEYTPESLNKTLPPHCPPKLNYVIQIVERMRQDHALYGVNSSLSEPVPDIVQWEKHFIRSGGFKHLFNLATQLSLDSKDSVCREESDWKKEALTALIRVLNGFMLEHQVIKKPIQLDRAQSQKSDVSQHTGVQFRFGPHPKKNRQRKLSRHGSNENAIEHAEIDVVVLKDEFLPFFENTAFIVEKFIKLIMNCIPTEVRLKAFMYPITIGQSTHKRLLRGLFELLDAWERTTHMPVRAFADNEALLFDFLMRVFIQSESDDISTDISCRFESLLALHNEETKDLQPMVCVLNGLLNILKKVMKNEFSGLDLIGKNAPRLTVCKVNPARYFRLIMSLLDYIPGEVLKEKFDLNKQCSLIANFIDERVTIESRPRCAEDPVLCGLLQIVIYFIEEALEFQQSFKSQQFACVLFNCLFEKATEECDNAPKCKSNASRKYAFIALTELAKNNFVIYRDLLIKLNRQHGSEYHKPYPWEYWPKDEMRSESDRVGMVNLGATCYMASTMQQLFMIPEARNAILNESNCNSDTKLGKMLTEMQYMFSFLAESQRKAFNPERFVRNYEMQGENLNPTEQRDMQEFYTDLLDKIAEMSPNLKSFVKNTFEGAFSNSIICLDCPHYSISEEVFTSVRIPVFGFRNIYESLQHIVAKDALEGDNMYNCDKCNKKVRAEKSMSFKRLPKILALNPLRYHFDMNAMTRIKVNSKFEFPVSLSMESVSEERLLPQRVKDELKNELESEENATEKINDCDEESLAKDVEDDKCYEYELIGFVVHTGTSEAGHYYAFLKDLEAAATDPDAEASWLSMNDTEVRGFSQDMIANEAFGGVIPSKTFESLRIDERELQNLVDMPALEKCNSAYMLFYERVDFAERRFDRYSQEKEKSVVKLPKLFRKWIWEDNTAFVTEVGLFDRFYFNFVWELCVNEWHSNNAIKTIEANDNAVPKNEECDDALVPDSGPCIDDNDTTFATARLAVNFLLETLVHSRDRHMMTGFVEFVTKAMSMSEKFCSWFLSQLADECRWVSEVLIKCPSSGHRDLIQRLAIHCCYQLRNVSQDLAVDYYFDERNRDDSAFLIGKFISRLIETMEELEHILYYRNYTEMLCTMIDLARMGNEECYALVMNDIIIKSMLIYERLRESRNTNGGAVSSLFQLARLEGNIIGGAWEFGNLSPNSEEDELRTLPVTADRHSRSLEKLTSLLKYLIEQWQLNIRVFAIDNDDASKFPGLEESMRKYGRNSDDFFIFCVNMIGDGVAIDDVVKMLVCFCLGGNEASKVNMLVNISVAKLNEAKGREITNVLKLMSDLINMSKCHYPLQSGSGGGGAAAAAATNSAVCGGKFVSAGTLMKTQSVGRAQSNLTAQTPLIPSFVDLFINLIGEIFFIKADECTQWLKDQCARNSKFRKYVIEKFADLMVMILRRTDMQRRDRERMINGLADIAASIAQLGKYPAALQYFTYVNAHGAYCANYHENVSFNEDGFSQAAIYEIRWAFRSLVSFLQDLADEFAPIYLDQNEVSDSLSNYFIVLGFLMDSSQDKLMCDYFPIFKKLFLTQVCSTVARNDTRIGLMFFLSGSVRYLEDFTQLVQDDEDMQQYVLKNPLLLISDAQNSITDVILRTLSQCLYYKGNLIMFSEAEILNTYNGEFVQLCTTLVEIAAENNNQIMLNALSYCIKLLVESLPNYVRDGRYPLQRNKYLNPQQSKRELDAASSEESSETPKEKKFKSEELQASCSKQREVKQNDIVSTGKEKNTAEEKATTSSESVNELPEERAKLLHEVRKRGKFLRLKLLQSSGAVSWIRNNSYLQVLRVLIPLLEGGDDELCYYAIDNNIALVLIYCLKHFAVHKKQHAASSKSLDDEMKFCIKFLARFRKLVNEKRRKHDAENEEYSSQLQELEERTVDSEFEESVVRARKERTRSLSRQLRNVIRLLFDKKRVYAFLRSGER